MDSTQTAHAVKSDVAERSIPAHARRPRSRARSGRAVSSSHLPMSSHRDVDAVRTRDRLRAAVDQAFVPMEAPLGHPREVAIFPPVTGG